MGCLIFLLTYQPVANATLRALVNNLSIASGPQVVVNDDRLGDGEDGEQMYPWKRWHVKSDPFGNNTEKAIEFFSSGVCFARASHVYTAFSLHGRRSVSDTEVHDRLASRWGPRPHGLGPLDADAEHLQDPSDRRVEHR